MSAVRIRHGLSALAAAAICALALPVLASADPHLDVSISHSPASIPRNEEQISYLLKVRNDASTNPAVGDTLTCNGVPAEWGGTKPWGGKPVANLSFAYQWLRDGAPIGGAAGAIPKGNARPTYEVTSADEGAEIQCLIRATLKATNEAENMGYAAVTQPGVVVLPLASPEAPQAEPLTNSSLSFAAISGEAVVGKQLGCAAPSHWAGSPTWSFEWLRNGLPIAEVEGGKGEFYEVKVADEHTQLQCLARATTGSGEAPTGGAAVAISEQRRVGALPAGIQQQPFLTGTNTSQIPSIEFSGSTSGRVKLELRLPVGGPETRAAGVKFVQTSGQQWGSGACRTVEPKPPLEPSELPVPGRVICETGATVGPQQELVPVEVMASIGPAVADPAIAEATISGGGSEEDLALDEFHFTEAIPFGVASFSTEVADFAENDYRQAGGHPSSYSTEFELTRYHGGEGQVLQVQFVKDLVDDLPQGLIGNPGAVPRLCSGTQAVEEDLFDAPTCPRSSVVGYASLVVGVAEAGAKALNFPVYAIKPERGAPAQFEIFLNAPKTLISLVPRLRASEGYGLRVEIAPLPKNPAVFSVNVKLCGYGARLRKSGESGLHLAGNVEAFACKEPGEGGAEGANPEPFITNATQCTGAPQVTGLAVDSWENKGALNPDGSPDYSDPNWHRYQATPPPLEGCDAVPFGPQIEFEPTNHRAEAPTGLNVTLTVPTEGLETPGAIAQSDLKKAVVTLPAGMSVNPSEADGLSACTPAEISLGTNLPVECPESSKVGSAAIETPLISEQIGGSVYLAKQGQNPFGSLLALYLVAESKERGILVKLPGKVTPGPDGQLTAEFDNTPQLPFRTLRVEFQPGESAPLLNPPSCGTYGVKSQLYPWSAPNSPVESTDTFQITEGPNGGGCPSGALEPQLKAGLQNPIAGTTSPFTTQLSRENGTQRFNGVNVSLPPGVTAYLKGIPYCADATLASISGAEGTGQAQIEHPSCPGASQIGTVSVGAGGGPYPYYVNTGRVYLASPYKGAPLSIAVVTPAVAGPFDLGTVVVRAALQINLETAQVTAVSDPLPTVLHGIPLDLRDIRVNLNRPNFTLAPTNCEAMAVTAQVAGENGGSAALANRFQVGGCGSLPFKPKLKLQLKGPTKRTGQPALKAVLTMPPGGANITRAQVGLPHSEFLEQGNLNKVCVQADLKAGTCPASSVYGHAKAWSPLLDRPLEGPVYLGVGYGHQLPDLVADLNGQIRILLHSKVDTTKKNGLRNTFEVVPDAPVSRFVLQMKGGKKYGLLTNSENVCSKTQRFNARFVAQNGKVSQTRPKIANDCGRHKKKRVAKRRHHR